MKIDLTKEEWEFLYRMCCYLNSLSEDMTDQRKGVTYAMYKNGDFARRFIYQKLGSEWVDDD